MNKLSSFYISMFLPIVLVAVSFVTNVYYGEPDRIGFNTVGLSIFVILVITKIFIDDLSHFSNLSISIKKAKFGIILSISILVISAATIMIIPFCIFWALLLLPVTFLLGIIWIFFNFERNEDKRRTRHMNWIVLNSLYIVFLVLGSIVVSNSVCLSITIVFLIILVLFDFQISGTFERLVED